MLRKMNSSRKMECDELLNLLENEEFNYRLPTLVETQNILSLINRIENNLKYKNTTNQIKVNIIEIWTSDLKDKLLQACKKHGSQWKIVSNELNNIANQQQCRKKFEQICPENWKSFSMINNNWSDLEILQLIDSVALKENQIFSKFELVNLNCYRSKKECQELLNILNTYPNVRIGK